MTTAQATQRQDPGRLIWLLIGPKAGDNTQMRSLGGALAAAGAWRVEEKRLCFHSGELLLHLASRPTLAGLRPPCRPQLVAPWPDLLITAGRRNELVARWIRERSGGRTRLVHLGRPWSRPERFDLVVSTRQYALPAGDRVLVNALPLQPGQPAADPGAIDTWRRRFEPLPRPWIAVLVGGDSGPFVFTRALADDMAARLNRFAGAHRGSLLISTSPRTPPGFKRRLQQRLEVPRHVHVWSAQARENPYAALLALADRVVVSAESMSMLTEALATGRPVYLAPVTAPGRLPWWLRPASYRWKPLTHRLAMAVAPARFTRDIGRIHAALASAGRVAWLGAGDPSATDVTEDPLAVTVARVRALLEAPAGGAP
ncbi:MAG: ELM1/GtrOC1 family putative glycosyltransferase [Pseudomonadales bacterium]